MLNVKLWFKKKKVLDTWTAYNDKLTTEEFDNHSLPDVGRMSEPNEQISVAEVKTVIAKKKNENEK